VRHLTNSTNHFVFCSQIIYHAVETGLVDAAFKKYIPIGEESTSVEREESLRVQHITLPLFVLAGGLMTSALAFLLEKTKKLPL